MKKLVVVGFVLALAACGSKTPAPAAPATGGATYGTPAPANPCAPAAPAGDATAPANPCAPK